MSDSGKVYINIFRPRGRGMKNEAAVVALILGGWLLAIVLSQLLVFLLENGGYEAVGRWTFFNLPIPFWLTGQFLPLWFVILCALFNLWIDRHSLRDMNASLRFKMRNEIDGRD